MLKYLVALGFTMSTLCAAAQDVDLRRFLESVNAGGLTTLETRKLLMPGEVRQYYQRTHHRPLWTGTPDAEKRLRSLVRAIESSQAHGFNTSRYHLGVLASDESSPTAREVLATDALIAQVRHRLSGAVSPQEIDPDWKLPVTEVDIFQFLDEAVTSKDIAQSLDALWPGNSEYQELLTRRAEILASRNSDTILVPDGPALKPGQSNGRVVLLKQRLFGPGEYTPLFDQELIEAVKAFQFAAGLDNDGVVGPATLEVLNANSFSWIDRIDANLERWRWLPLQLPDTYIRVNIASYQLRVISEREEVMAMPVIVGRPYRRTPVFTKDIQYLVFNPYWNVPGSIARKDKLPLLKKDPYDLESKGYEVRAKDATEFIGVSKVDWQVVQPGQFSYALRQKPGPTNALGEVKFMLPNPYSVYLHDTPDHTLFGKQERAFSSGCIRLSNPRGLAQWVLENDGQSMSIEAVGELVETGETKTRYLKTPLPVLIVYFTAFTDKDNEVIFRRDIYQRDESILEVLRGRA